ncbi:MAG: hypothetical protein JNK72_14675 [Myxococcales bacterium]|nr:hypothetical protein [Myxococcales bacterium]
MSLLCLVLGCRTPAQGQGASPPSDTVSTPRVQGPPETPAPDAASVDVPLHNAPPPEPPPQAHPAEGAPFPSGHGVRAAGFESAAVAPPVWIGEALYGVFATPSTNNETAQLRFVRWSGEGVIEVSTHDVHGVAPGGAIASLATAEGATFVWQTPGPDGGQGVWALPCTRSGCGAERVATGAEQTASQWAFNVFARRSREGITEMAPEVSQGGAAVRFERLRTVAVARVGDTELARSADLMGYLRAAGVAPGDGGEVFAALSRGSCAEHRIELFRVRGSRAESLGVRPIGEELGVRWMRVTPGPGGRVAVSWYQELIPLRLQCTRGEGAPSPDDHGLRVTVFGP